MTLPEILAEMRRGCCSAHKVATEGCATCAPTMRAIEAVRARFSLPVVATCGDCAFRQARIVRGRNASFCGFNDFDAGPVVARTSPPPSTCPLRDRP